MSPAVRTDFSNETSWKHICDDIRKPSGAMGFIANVEFISDAAFDGLTPNQLVDGSTEDMEWPCAFLIDKIAMTHPEHPILVVDLLDEPGRTFRVIPEEVWAVENNLSVGNVSFAELADAVDSEGILRTLDTDSGG